MTMKDWPHANLFYLIRPFALNLCCIFQLKDYIKRISSNGDAFFSLSYHFLSRRSEESIDIRILIVSTYKIHINHWGFGSSGLFRVLAHHNSPGPSRLPRHDRAFFPTQISRCGAARHGHLASSQTLEWQAPMILAEREQMEQVITMKNWCAYVCRNLLMMFLGNLLKLLN